MLPRLIRGGFDNFSATVKEYLPFLKIKFAPVFFGMLSIIIYYFSSLYALSQLVNKQVEFLFGEKNFAPLLNLIRRLLPFLRLNRINLIEEPARIPFNHNIYSIVGDIYMDFGFLGLIFVPFLFGLLIGSIFKRNGIIADSLKAFFIAWLLFTPIYNVFSFGAFFFSFAFLMILLIFVKFDVKTDSDG